MNALSPRVTDVIQGEASVMLGERLIGHVSRRYGTSADAGWHAYNALGHEVTKFACIKRTHAVDELVRKFAQLQEVPA